MTTPGQFLDRTFVPPTNRKPVYDVLQLGFTDDGHPGRVIDGEVKSHPLYACYVINDLLNLHRDDPADRYLEAAEIVAQAALGRMTDVDGALLYYDQGWINGVQGQICSALIQARYLGPLGELANRAQRPDLREAARRVMRGLQIPTSQHGPMLERPYGPVLEEFPNVIPVYILNGWTTALVAVLEHAERVDDRDAREFGLAGCDALLTIIDRFDVEELANTRYMLTQATKLRVEVADPAAIRFLGGTTTLPAEGAFDFVAGSSDPWQNWYTAAHLDQGGRVATADRTCDVNVVLSQSGNTAAVRLDLAVDQPTTLVVRRPVGEYDPVNSEQTVVGWEEHARLDLQPGAGPVDLAFRMADFRYVGHPTNFGKPQEDKRYNVYHYLHCHNLRALLEKTGDVRMVSWLVRWIEYIALWHRMPLYRDDDRFELVHIPTGRPRAFS